MSVGHKRGLPPARRAPIALGGTPGVMVAAPAVVHRPGGVLMPRPLTAPEQVEALHGLIARLAPEEGIVQDEQGGCVWCGAGDSWIGSPEHGADCPWLEARSIVSPEEAS